MQSGAAARLTLSSLLSLSVKIRDAVRVIRVRLLRTPSRGGGEGGAAGDLSFFFSLASVQRGLHETPEQRVSLCRLRLELGVTLHRQEPRVVAQLDHLDELAVWAEAREEHAVGRELLAVLVVELVAVPVPLGHL